MTQDPQHLIGALLAALRAPQRVVGDIEKIASRLLSLQGDARDRLASVDEGVAALLQALIALRTPLEHVERDVAVLAKLEAAVTERMDAMRDDLDARLRSVEEEVRAMRSPLERTSRDVANIMELLPNASDGPLARLKDTLTSS